MKKLIIETDENYLESIRKNLLNAFEDAVNYCCSVYGFENEVTLFVAEQYEIWEKMKLSKFVSNLLRIMGNPVYKSYEDYTMKVIETAERILLK